MSCSQPTDRGSAEPITPAQEDTRTERIVLMNVLALHPVHLSIPELVRRIAIDSEDFATTDAVERAIRDLTGVGLLRCPGCLVMPTQPALHFNRLSDV